MQQGISRETITTKRHRTSAMNSSVLLIRSGLWFEISGKDVTLRSFSFLACNHCSLSFSVLYRFNCITSFRTQRFWIPLPQNPSFHHPIMFIGIHIWLRTFSLHRSTFIQPWINFSCPFRRPLIFLWHLHVVLWFFIGRGPSNYTSHPENKNSM